MKRKRIVILMIACVLLGGYTAGIYAQPETGVTRVRMERPDTEENREAIAENVLRDTGRLGAYDMNDLENVTVYYGNVTENPERDAVITASFGPKDTVVAAYTPEGEVYEYVGDIGQFFGVRNIQFVPVPDIGKDVVIVRETAEQSIGAYENTDTIRGYLLNEGQEFENVLQTTEKIEAVWNAIWDTEDLRNETNWLKVTEATESSWDLGESPALDITRYQEYLTAEDTQDGRIPPADTFESDSKRVVIERYYWAEDWGRFILGEALLAETGEKVAILENRDASPYFLGGFRDNTFRIAHGNGEEEIVNGTELEQLTPQPGAQGGGATP